MEHALRDYIRNHLHPELLSLKGYHSVTVRRLASGCYNINYLVKANAKPFVFRVNVHHDAFEGGHLEHEYRTLKKLDGFHAPKALLLDNRFEHQFIVEEFIASERIATLSNQIIRRIARALAEIHTFDTRTAASPSIKDVYIADFDNRLKIIAKDKEVFQAVLGYVDAAKRYIQAKDRQFGRYAKNALLHGDMHCRNVMVRDKEIVFIDWENSRFGDPAFDIAAFFYESENLQHFSEKGSISEAQKRLFLSEYLKINPDPHLQEKISIIYPLRWLSDTLWLACRIVDYRNIPAELRERERKEYIRLYRFNLGRLRRLLGSNMFANIDGN